MKRRRPRRTGVQREMKRLDRKRLRANERAVLDGARPRGLSVHYGYGRPDPPAQIDCDGWL